MTEGWAITIFSNALVVFLGIVAATWKLGSIKSDILGVMAEHAKQDTKEFNLVRKEMAEEFDTVRNEIDDTARSFGETVAAIRQRVSEVELSTAQQYVRRDGFYKVMAQLNDNIATMRKEIREDINRMGAKIDAIK